VDVGIIVGVIGAAIGAIGLALALRGRGKVRELDAELRRPEVVVKMAARGRESEGLKRIQASVAVTNTGATAATDVRFGLRVYGEELQADQIPELDVDETCQVGVFVPIELEERLQARHTRLEEAACGWARYTDNRGRRHEIATS
jgi:cation diffusion facilitator CzcD-associated flavoprotein CzcO